MKRQKVFVYTLLSSESSLSLGPLQLFISVLMSWNTTLHSSYLGLWHGFHTELIASGSTTCYCSWFPRAYRELEHLHSFKNFIECFPSGKHYVSWRYKDKMSKLLPSGSSQSSWEIPVSCLDRGLSKVQDSPGEGMPVLSGWVGRFPWKPRAWAEEGE